MSVFTVDESTIIMAVQVYVLCVCHFSLLTAGR